MYHKNTDPIEPCMHEGFFYGPCDDIFFKHNSSAFNVTSNVYVLYIYIFKITQYMLNRKQYFYFFTKKHIIIFVFLYL